MDRIFIKKEYEELTEKRNPVNLVNHVKEEV